MELNKKLDEYSSDEDDYRNIDWTNSKLFQKILSGTAPNDHEYSDIEFEDIPIFKKSRKILSNIECTYQANLLKKKLDRKDELVEDFTETSKLALKSLYALMTLLLLKP